MWWGPKIDDDSSRLVSGPKISISVLKSYEPIGHSENTVTDDKKKKKKTDRQKKEKDKKKTRPKKIHVRNKKRLKTTGKRNTQAELFSFYKVNFFVDTEIALRNNNVSFTNDQGRTQKGGLGVRGSKSTHLLFAM